jgi:hypothetical protein
MTEPGGLKLRITADRGKCAVFVELFRFSSRSPIMRLRFDSGPGSDLLKEVSLYLGSHLHLPDASATIDLTRTTNPEGIEALCGWEMETWDHEDGRITT